VTPGSPALALIVEAFGKEVLLPDGTLNRAALGAVVFADAGSAASSKGSCTLSFSPRSTGASASWSGPTRRAGSRRGRADPRAGAAERFDAIVVVWAEEEQQRLRMMLPRRTLRRGAGRRLAAQMPLAEKRRRADLVVDNSRDLAACRADAERVYGELLRLARAGKRR